MSADGAATARVMWRLLEPIHAITYFSPVALAAFTEAGLRGFWRGYFAGRAAPLGAVGPAPVLACFYGFAPAMVTRALPSVWTMATPAQALAAREDGSRRALTELNAGAVGDEALAEAAELVGRAVAGCELAGRVLGSANAATAEPADPLGRLWRSATIVREHRGDGHVAALVAAGLGPCESLVWRAATDLRRDVLQAARGWTDDEWTAAEARLVERGWLDADGKPTPVGTEGYADIERRTDEAAAAGWSGVDTGRVVELLTPLSLACAGQLPAANPLGLPRPSSP
jgi:hypothetical protein